MSEHGTNSVKTFTLAEIAAELKCPPPAASRAALPITGVAALDDAGATQLSFLTSEHYHKQYEQTSAAAVLVDKKIKLKPAGTRAVVLIVENAESAMARVLEMFALPVPHPPPGIDPAACIDPTAIVAGSAAIGPFVVVGARTTIGNGTIVHAGVHISNDVTIGEGCQLFPHVTVRERITIGNRVIIHANSTLGTDGFGYRWDGKRHAKVPQIGTVIIEDDVEIGSGVCVDRAKFGATRIGMGSKIDNLVQVAHNVRIGPHCIIAGQAGLAGSVRLGAGVILGGQVGVRDHITLGPGAMAAASAGIVEDVDAGIVVSGVPALPHRQSLREQAALRRLPDLVVQVRKLQEQVEQLKGK